MTESLFREAAAQLDARTLDKRLAALVKLRELEQRGALGPATPKIGPALPSYDHVHSCVSYGDAAPGVFSVARMVWAAHEARAFSILSVEHESVAHMDEAIQATTIVNRGMEQPLRLALAVEFKTPIALNDAVSKKFSDAMLKAWGQGESAWVVAVGARRTPELERLVRQFQEAKRVRAAAHGVPSGQAMTDGNLTGDAEIFRVNRLIGFRVGQHCFGMNPGLVNERARSGDVVVERND